MKRGVLNVLLGIVVNDKSHGNLKNRVMRNIFLSFFLN